MRQLSMGVAAAEGMWSGTSIPRRSMLVSFKTCAPFTAGKIHWRNTREQLSLVGPRSLGVALLTASFVGMVFTIQVETAHTLACP